MKYVLGNRETSTIILGVVFSVLLTVFVNPFYALIISLSPVVFILTRLMKITLTDLIIILLPVMFYAGAVGSKINLSLADFLFPFLLFKILNTQKYKKSFTDTIVNQKNVYIYAYILIMAMFISFFVNIIGGNTSFSGVVSIVKMMINMAYFVIFLIIFKTELNENRLHLFKTWAWTATIFSLVCIIAVVLFEFGLDLKLSFEYRASGTFEDPNLCAAYLIISLGISLAYNFQRNRQVFNLNVLLIITALILTASRSAAIGLLMGVVLTIIFSLNNKGARKILKLVILLAFLSVVISFISKLMSDSSIFEPAIDRISTFGADDSDTSYRFLLWKAAVELFKQNPFFGVGAGNYILSAKQQYAQISNIPHNTYLTFLAESGLIGFLAFIWLPFSLGLRLLLNMIKGRTQSAFYFIAFVSISVVAFSINLENFRILWVFLALISALNYNYQAGKKQTN